MDWLFLFKAALIGIVEGITEFLPISSTGHMIIVGNLIGFNKPYGTEYSNMFMIVIQLGAILAIVYLYWKKIKRSLIEFKDYGLKLWTTIIIAFLPSAVIGLLLNDVIDKYLMKPVTVILALLVGAFLMLFMEKKYRRKAKIKRIEDVKPKQALVIGFFQCLAMWPGMSRSASTIMGGWFTGLNNVSASEFSFFLAIPTMVAATGLKLKDAILDGNNINFNLNTTVALIIGFIIAFLVALVVVDSFIAFLKRKPMRIFAFYRILIAIILIILLLTKTISFAVY
ncbi:undecaprenyl-diphosphate phosphatase [Clostridium oryzae]|uniref:Undecaprenyl-diphosphatase n=1 Tax=Clostridium oryzae TaxID=1450648 RepID=A0A1V4IGN6_9CLOT|nr:undecaprenyl-diphosphate phosphatase [Clostridium oryzae]OPJ59010.1 undecaprenyl-diphosphatase [Clostridium oryzae]